MLVANPTTPSEYTDLCRRAAAGDDVEDAALAVALMRAGRKISDFDMDVELFREVNQLEQRAQSDTMTAMHKAEADARAAWEAHKTAYAKIVVEAQAKGDALSRAVFQAQARIGEGKRIHARLIELRFSRADLFGAVDVETLDAHTLIAGETMVHPSDPAARHMQVDQATLAAQTRRRCELINAANAHPRRREEYDREHDKWWNSPQNVTRRNFGDQLVGDPPQFPPPYTWAALSKDRAFIAELEAIAEKDRQKAEVGR
jgi:hypothetical protein